MRWKRTWNANSQDKYAGGSVALKDIFAKKSRLCHDLPTSVKDNEFSLFREGFIFAKLRFCEVSRK